MEWNLIATGTKVYKNNKLFGYVICTTCNSYLKEIIKDENAAIVYRVDGDGWNIDSVTDRLEQRLISERMSLLKIKDPNPTFWYIYGYEDNEFGSTVVSILENE